MDMTDTNPAAPWRLTGASSTRTLYDHLPLGGGKSIGQVANEQLRPILARFGVEGAHTEGRNIICARYAVMLQKVHDDAGNAAVRAWLENNRG
jgi:hypothetical protein